MSIKLPNKFIFSTFADDDCQMTFRNGVYYCTRAGVEAQDHHNTWTVKQTQRNVDAGDWKITKNLDEPELVLPFTFKHYLTPTIYTVLQGSLADSLRISDGHYHNVDNQYTKSSAAEYIKDGEWIVQSVGPSARVGSPKVEGSTKPSEAPTIDANTLTIQVDSSAVKEATEAFKELAQGIENVNIALESMKEIMADMGLTTEAESVDMNGRPLSSPPPIHINAVHDFNFEGRGY